MKFTEAQLEAAIIELLDAEGYPHVPGEDIDRQPHEVLIKDDLRAFLARHYATDGIKPTGETYFSIENSKGEYGYYLVGDGENALHYSPFGCRLAYRSGRASSQ